MKSSHYYQFAFVGEGLDFATLNIDFEVLSHIDKMHEHNLISARSIMARSVLEFHKHNGSDVEEVVDLVSAIARAGVDGFTSFVSEATPPRQAFELSIEQISSEKYDLPRYPMGEFRLHPDNTLFWMGFGEDALLSSHPDDRFDEYIESDFDWDDEEKNLDPEPDEVDLRVAYGFED